MLPEKKLEKLYFMYNRREFVSPDPLQFLYARPDTRDREIVGFIASALAYGRVERILFSVKKILDILGPSPSDFLSATRHKDRKASFSGFVHRFARDTHLAALLTGIADTSREYGSLGECFHCFHEPANPTVFEAACGFVDALRSRMPEDPGHLLPRPEKGSACKRLHLFFRWMVRKDAVDPGGWDRISPSGLLIPLDVHMHRICGMLGMTVRKAADLRTAMEITRGFREISPEDPVKYDFALTRLGIRKEMDPEKWLSSPD